MSGPDKLLPNIAPKYEKKDVILARLTTRVLSEKKIDEPYIVGFDGPPGVGKSTFAEQLAACLRAEGKKVEIIKADHYMNPRDIRISQDNPAETHYESTIDVSRLEAEVLKPIKEKGNLQAEMYVFDEKTDSYTKHVHYDIDGDTFVILEGIYLFKDQIRDYSDLKIFLEAEEDVLHERLHGRHSTETDKPQRSPEQTAHRANTAYIPAYRAYAARDLPSGYADVVVETAREGVRVLASRGVRPKQNTEH